MAKRKQATPLSLDAISALRAARYEGNKMWLTQDNLACYPEIKALVGALGGAWKSAAKVHEFSEGVNAADLLLSACDRGEIPASNPLDYYPTPKVVIEQMLDDDARCMFEAKRISAEIDGRPLRFLEPSGGSGALAEVLHSQMWPSDSLVIVEANPVMAAGLRQRFPEAEVVEGDFLDYATEDKFDVVMMNPPFAGVTYQKHVAHAFGLLRRCGNLLAVAPAGFVQQANDFLRFVNQHGSFERIPGNPFAGVKIAMEILRLENDPRDPRDEPVDGYPSWHHWHAAVSVANDCRLRDQLCKAESDEDRLAILTRWADEMNVAGSFQRMNASIVESVVDDLRRDGLLPEKEFRLEYAA